MPEAFGPTQRKVLLAFKAATHQEINVAVLFAMTNPNTVPSTVRLMQQRMGGFVVRLNRTLIRLGLRECMRPGKSRNTYKLWKSETEYRKWRGA